MYEACRESMMMPERLCEQHGDTTFGSLSDKARVRYAGHPNGALMMNRGWSRTKR